MDFSLISKRPEEKPCSNCGRKPIKQYDEEIPRVAKVTEPAKPQTEEAFGPAIEKRKKATQNEKEKEANNDKD